MRNTKHFFLSVVAKRFKHSKGHLNEGYSWDLIKTIKIEGSY